MENNRLRSWVEISRNNLVNNYNTYKEHISNNMNIMAVVKADAYGYGDRIIGKVLSDIGVRYFAVSNIDEAIHIRIAGVEGIILIFGYTPTERTNELLQYDITQALLSEEYAGRIAELNLPIKCQFAIDTGMRRIGLNADDTDYCEHIIREYANKLKLEGVFTHLCVADTPEQDEFTRKQIKKFDTLCDRTHLCHHKKAKPQENTSLGACFLIITT